MPNIPAKERPWEPNSARREVGQLLRPAQVGLGRLADRIVLAGATAIDEIAMASPEARLALIGSATLAARASMRGLVLTDRDADFALLTRDVDFTYERLERLVRLLSAGTELIVANIDATHPAADGGLVPETGALLGAVKTCLPGLRYRAIGKPEEALFRAALLKAGVESCEAIVIGDNPETDGEGARRAECVEGKARRARAGTARETGRSPRPSRRARILRCNAS